MSSAIIATYFTTNSVKIDDSMTLRPMTSAQDSKQMSFVWAEIDGVHSKRRNNRSEKMYIVKEGELDVITSNHIQTLKSGDVSLIPAGLWCELKGRSAVIGIACSPAFDPLDEELQ